MIMYTINVIMFKDNIRLVLVSQPGHYFIYILCDYCFVNDVVFAGIHG